jgi:hypothetical protein
MHHPRQGQVYRDDQALILEFEEVGRFKNSEIKEVRIPFSEITSLEVQYNWNAGYSEFVIQTARLSALAGLPLSKNGRGRLKIDWGQRRAARELIDSILRRSPPRRGQADAERAGMEVVAPAIGMLLSGVVGLLAYAVLFVLLALPADGVFTHRHVWFGLGGLVTVLSAATLVRGAVSMLRLRSYVLSVSAAFAAMVPLSPGWVLSLPMGIWALIVLRRPEVMGAFLKKKRASQAGVPVPTERPGVGGRMRSLFRSIRGYFVTTSG